MERYAEFSVSRWKGEIIYDSSITLGEQEDGQLSIPTRLHSFFHEIKLDPEISRICIQIYPAGDPVLDGSAKQRIKEVKNFLSGTSEVESAVCVPGMNTTNYLVNFRKVRKE